MSARFWSDKPFVKNLQLTALFCTIFSFLTRGSNFRQNNSCAERFEPNFERMLLTKAHVRQGALHKF